MKNQDLIKHLQNIKRLSQSPMANTVNDHLQALIVCIENDNSELEQAKKEYAAPVPGKIKENNYDKEQHNIDADIILEHIDDVLAKEFNILIEEANNEEKIKKFNSMRLRIFEKIRNKVTGRTTQTVPVIQCHAVFNLWLANNNIRKDDLIKNVFSETENKSTVMHYEEIFKDMGYNIFDFFVAIGEDQRCLIIQYIMKNYSGVKMQDIEKHVI